LKYIYLCGGIVTIVTMPLIGRLADLFGKLRLFRIFAVATMVPILLMTNLPAGLELALVLCVTTAFMVASSGRMVPAMALITASSAPSYRGQFMSLNSAVQHLSSGLAASGAGLLLAKQADGSLAGFTVVGLVSCAAMALSLFLAGRLRPAVGGAAAPDSAAVEPEVAVVPAE